MSIDNPKPPETTAEEIEACAQEFIKELVSILYQESLNPSANPLMPFTANNPQAIRRIFELILQDEWLIANAGIICIPSQEAKRRHVCFTIKRSLDYWTHDPHAHALMQANAQTRFPSSEISAYHNISNYFQAALDALDEAQI